MNRLVTLCALVALPSLAVAADSDGDGCEDIQYALNGACISPVALVGSNVTLGAGAVVHDQASIGSDVAIGAGVVIGKGVQLGGRFEHVLNPVSVGASTVIMRYATIGVDPIIGANSTFGRTVGVGHRLTAGDGVNVGYASQLGDDVTLLNGATVAPFTDIGDYATVGANAVLARGVTVDPALSLAEGAVVHGTVGAQSNIGTDVLVSSDSRVRKFSRLESGAQIINGARVGRGATIRAGAVVDAGRVPTGAVVCENATLLSTDHIRRGDMWPPLGCLPPCESGYAEFTAPGADSLQVPVGCTTVRIDVVGGGGGGAGYVWRQARSGGGGGGGGYGIWDIASESTLAIVVGAGGGANTPGGDTTVSGDGYSITATGGERGFTGNTVSPTFGGTVLGDFDAASVGGGSPGCTCLLDPNSPTACNSVNIPHNNPPGTPGGAYAAGGGACQSGVNGGTDGAGGLGGVLGYGGDGGVSGEPGQDYGGGGGGGHNNPIGADGYVRVTWSD